MSGGDPSGALRDIGSLFRGGMLGELTDRQLLDRFVNRTESSAEDAFVILLERHGPMVWGVCRRLLKDRDAAADAFQATFLVLVRKASAVRVDDSLGPWLYGVSRRVAARARAASQRGGARQIDAVEPVAGTAFDSVRVEQLAILDEEVARLPEHQRGAVVLCDLESLPHEEAARRLGCPVGTVESRLSRGRQRLRDRLIRRGLAPTAAALWAESARKASASMPVALFKQTCRVATSSPAAGAVPVAVTALAEGVIRMMWLARFKPLAVVAAALVLTTAGVAVHARQKPAPNGAPGQAKTAPRPNVGADTVPEIAANRTLAREQVALADEALTMLQALARNSRVSIGDPAFSLWERRWVEALRRTGAGKAEMVAALEKYIERLKEAEEIAKARHQSARGTLVEVHDVKFRLTEAAIWLNEEKAR